MQVVLYLMLKYCAEKKLIVEIVVEILTHKDAIYTVNSLNDHIHQKPQNIRE